MTEDSEYRLREHLEEHLGIPIGDMTLGEGLRQAVGKKVVAHISHQEGKKDKNTKFVRIDDWAPYDGD